MILSPKAKAWAALVITTIVGAFGAMVQLGLVTGDAIKWAGVITSAVAALLAPLGVYLTTNSPSPVTPVTPVTPQLPPTE